MPWLQNQKGIGSQTPKVALSLSFSLHRAAAAAAAALLIIFGWLQLKPKPAINITMG